MALGVRHAQLVLFAVNALALTACLSSKDDAGKDGADPAAGGGAPAEGGRSGGNGSGGNAGSGGSAGVAGTPGTTGGASGMAGGSGGSGLVVNGAAPTANVEFGLDTRPSNATCKDPGRPTGQTNDPFPQMLSATGCFSAANPKQPTAGLIPYDVSSPLWSDNADKQRYMALPEGKKIKITADGDFEFPIGTVLLKTFALNGAMLETRFLIRHSDGQWGTYTYVWNEAGTDAKLQGEASDSRFFGNDEWVFPSRTDCVGCHTAPVGRAIGPETRQMNSVFEYGPNKRANQLKTLDHLNMFETKLGDVTKLPALPTPKYAVGATLEQRARSYLHANCSHCHQPGGTPDAMGKDQVSIDFRFDTPFKMMNVCNVPPTKNNYGFADIMLLTPGNAEMDAGRDYLKKSMISVRMHSTTDKVRMPQIGTKVVDKLGTQIVDAWIKSLAGCPP